MAWAAIAGVIAFLAGCSPTFDWRDSRLPEAGLAFSLPCRPDHQARTVPLAGQSVTMALQVCEVQGQTFAVSAVDMQDPARIGTALQALAESFRHNLGPEAVPQPVPRQPVPGETPQPAAGRWTLQARTPQGEKLQAEQAVFSRGTWVVQATVLARQPLAPEAVRVFFEGLRFAH